MKSLCIFPPFSRRSFYHPQCSNGMFLVYFRLDGAARSFVCRGDAAEANTETGIIPADFTRRTSAVEMLSAGSN